MSTTLVVVHHLCGPWNKKLNYSDSAVEGRCAESHSVNL